MSKSLTYSVYRQLPYLCDVESIQFVFDIKTHKKPTPSFGSVTCMQGFIGCPVCVSLSSSFPSSSTFSLCHTHPRWHPCPSLPHAHGQLMVFQWVRSDVATQTYWSKAEGEVCTLFQRFYSLFSICFFIPINLFLYCVIIFSSIFYHIEKIKLQICFWPNKL